VPQADEYWILAALRAVKSAEFAEAAKRKPAEKTFRLFTLLFVEHCGRPAAKRSWWLVASTKKRIRVLEFAF
jgi:hypothetical protein